MAIVREDLGRREPLNDIRHRTCPWADDATRPGTAGFREMWTSYYNSQAMNLGLALGGVMKFPRLFSQTFSLRRAAATIFALTALLPLLLFLYILWRYELVTETEVQVGIFLALIIALLGFVIFRRMVDRISKLAQTVATSKPADLVAPPGEAAVPAVPGLGQVAEIGQIADAFGRMLVDLRASTDRLEDLVFKLSTLNEMVELSAKIPKIQDLLSLVLERTMRTVRASIGSIMLVDPERQILRVAAARGLSEELIANVEIKMGEGIAGKVALLGEPVLVVVRSNVVIQDAQEV